MLSPASIRRAASAASILLFGSADARALDPARALSQYALQQWSSAAGLPHESIQALAQTPDGYLWLGTMGGLVRFDGVRFTAYTSENSGLPHDNVWSRS